MKKTILAAAMALGITCSSCLGPDNLYNGVKHWNAEISDIDVVNEVIFIGLMVIPVYPFALLGDVVIFNTIGYWINDDVIKNPGPFPGFYQDKEKAAENTAAAE